MSNWHYKYQQIFGFVEFLKFRQANTSNKTTVILSTQRVRRNPVYKIITLNFLINRAIKFLFIMWNYSRKTNKTLQPD